MQVYPLGLGDFYREQDDVVRGITFRGPKTRDDAVHAIQFRINADQPIEPDWFALMIIDVFIN